MTKRFGLRLAAGSIVIGAITLGALGSATASADITIDRPGDRTTTVTVGGASLKLGNGDSGGGLSLNNGGFQILWGQN
ncbi:hypothetical protein [Smaragdicoccus niigatensis]|uniref:hypothetical protein n=1 Tax=Smaragdicoccus niigatensis TaxID=359359 RepID=UPI0012DC2F5A|nr:hypothetical protein [Smaragdicoccus niigatensis]